MKNFPFLLRTLALTLPSCDAAAASVTSDTRVEHPREPSSLLSVSDLSSSTSRLSDKLTSDPQTFLHAAILNLARLVQAAALAGDPVAT